MTWKRNILAGGYDIIAQIKHRFSNGTGYHEVGRRFIKDDDLIGINPTAAALVVRELMEQAENSAQPTKQ